MIGQFIHGELGGIILIKLLDERFGFLSVKDGVIHGPAVIAGTVPILPVSH